MTDSSTHHWNDSWPESVKAGVRERGFSSLVDALKAREAVPYSTVATELGGVPPIQLIALAFKEAKRNNELRWVVCDCLCRNIVEKCGDGWGIGSDCKSTQMRALASWISEVTGTGDCPDLKDEISSLAKELLSKEIDSTWMPASNSDAILQSLFNELHLH